MEIAEQIESTVLEVGDRVRPQLDDAKRRLTSLNKDVTSYIKENTGRCLLGAIAVGFVIGKIARRA